MIKRLFPAPLLSVALFVVWLLLNQSLSAGQMLMGLLVALVVPVMTAGLRPLPVRIRHPLTVLRLGFTVVADTTQSNLQVARFLLFPSLRRHPADFVTIPLELRDPTALAALAMITTVVPGTVWSELARDASAVRLHVWDVQDDAAFIAHYKSTYEAPLLEIYQ